MEILGETITTLTDKLYSSAIKNPVNFLLYKRPRMFNYLRGSFMWELCKNWSDRKEGRKS